MIAAGAIYLGRLSVGISRTWNEGLEKMTGCRLEDIMQLVDMLFKIFRKKRPNHATETEILKNQIDRAVGSDFKKIFSFGGCNLSTNNDAPLNNSMFFQSS